MNAFGGYKVQGKTEDAAAQLIKDAKAHDNAGASIVLMECVPADLARQITKACIALQSALVQVKIAMGKFW